MPNVLTRAVLAIGQQVGLLARPWRGLGLPMRIVVGPTSGGRLLFAPRESAESLPAVIGAVCLLCDALCALSWQIVQRKSPAAGEEIVTNHDAAHCLAAWSLYQRWAWVYSALTAGNGIAWNQRNARDAPGRLRTYPADRVAFRLFDDGRLSALLTPPTMGEVMEVPTTECAVLRYRPSGFDERIGISPLIQAAGTTDLLLQNRNAVRATMRNASRPSGYLATAGKLDRDKANEIRDRWRSTYGQDGEAQGGTAVLEQGLEYKTIALNDLQELAAVETSRLGIGDVARLFNVPPSLLLGVEQNRATATEDRRRLISFAVEPLARLAEDALAETLLTSEQRSQGFGVRIDTSVAMLGQGNELGQAISSLLNSGAVSVNEARQRIGLASVEGGDMLRSPANTWPLDAWLDARPKSSDTTAAQSDASTRILRLLRGELAGE